MTWNLTRLTHLTGVLTMLALETHAPPAEACGVKLTIKSSSPRRAVAHTSNPSEVLLLGTPPSRLTHDLTAAGHHVEVSSTAAGARRKQYAVVIADASLQNEARSTFTGSVVVVRSEDVTADLRSVEHQVARRSVAASEARQPIAARENRQPIAAGPERVNERKLIGTSPAKDPTIEPVTATPVTPKPVTPKPVRVETAKPVRVETKPDPKPDPKPVTEPKVAVEAKAVPEPKEPKEPKEQSKQVAKASAPGEVYFGLGGAKGGTGGLAKAARWLKDSPDISVVIEGHADPTGNPEDNMTLSQRRAEWVRDYLVSAGIDASRLEVMAFGDTRLKYGKTDSRNRRVAIVAK